MYSRAVQVFALLSIEAFLNEYGYLRLGEDVFEKKVERLGPVHKLKKVLAEAIDYEVPEDSEIIDLVRNLSHHRNTLIHPRPEMEVWNEDGSIIRTARRLGGADILSAESAASQMQRFFELFILIDPEAAQILGHM